MEFKTIIVEKREGVARITLNRPEKLNALNDRMLSELLGAIEDFDRDDSVGAVIITGTGRSFSAGMDMKGRLAAREEEFVAPPPLPGAIESLTKPVIAAVNGFCYTGALEIVLCADMIIASENATFADTHARYGMFHGWGGTQRLPRIVGTMRAKEVMLTGESISAREAERIGLVNRVVPQDKLDETAQELAQRIVANSSFSVKALKSVINRGMKVDLAEGLDMELAEFDRFHKDEAAKQESKQRLGAFSEKRKV